MKTLLVGALAFAMSACAHSAMRGTVAMKLDSDKAHVCLGKGEVKAGDKVVISKNECAPKRSCRIVPVGEGEVVELLNDHYSVVKAPGVAFEEGYMVVKK